MKHPTTPLTRAALAARSTRAALAGAALSRAVLTRAALAGAALAGITVAALGATPALADPSPAPSTPVTIAGTSFLTAVPVTPGRPVDVPAVTGDYLYWSFAAEAGQRPDLTAEVALPPATDRHGTQSWTVEVFDGLRRRQPCVAGDQSPRAAKEATSVALRCQLRQVRSWAEPSDGDPLPGTYYVRLSSSLLPDQDLGLPIKVHLTLAAPKGDTGDDQGILAAPLNPENSPGTVNGTIPPLAEEDDDGWLPEFSSRWIWTAGGGILAALTGIIGFALTRRRRPRAA
ncbi:peptidase [Symbioplanes lichenis]|uniref:peptidase n=1 Tax=Symbioplanes lichenis TaxID=1629072 RepID=UPI002739EE71|nr:peptidase [Actinoplanes lichenis]